MRKPLFVLLLLLVSCSEEQGADSPFQLDLNEVLGGDATGFRRAVEPRDFSFPEDHSGHAGFRNEWWYLTGNLTSAEGRRYGYQVTFFSFTLEPETQRRPAGSAWDSPRLWMAHAALTDSENQSHIALERFSRENPGLAGASLDPFRVWLENWSLEGSGNNFPWRLTVEDEAFGLDLVLEAAKDPVLQGIDGLSHKSPEEGNASYYYSFTRLTTAGRITLDGEVFNVSGASWMDREWSTSVLADDQTGWDWFSLQFDDNRELMYYQLRTTGGEAHPNSLGNWTSPDATQTLILPEDIRLQEIENWRGPNGVEYTTLWRMSYQDNDWVVRAIMEEQFMDLSVPYWEGAVDVLDFESGEVVGQGYVEMVRQ